MRLRPPDRETRALAGLWLLVLICVAILRPLAPAVAAQAPACLFHEATGLPCLSCGLTRATLALGRGDVAEALQWNPLVAAAEILFVAGGLIVPLWVWRGGPVPAWSGRLSPAARWAVVGGLLLNWGYLIWRGV